MPAANEHQRCLQEKGTALDVSHVFVPCADVLDSHPSLGPSSSSDLFDPAHMFCYTSDHCVPFHELALLIIPCEQNTAMNV